MQSGKFKIIRMPKTAEEISGLLEEFSGLLDKMYSDKYKEYFGEFKFRLDQFLMMWDTGSAFFIARHADDTNRLLSLAVVTVQMDLWSSVSRLDVQRVAFADGVNADAEALGLAEFLLENADAIGVDAVYYGVIDDECNEYKQLLWRRE